MAEAGQAGGHPRPPAGGRRLSALPAQPLVDAVERAGGLGELLPCPRDSEARALARYYYNARQSGTVTAHAADRLAVELLGTHPAAIYGADWSRT